MNSNSLQIRETLREIGKALQVLFLFLVHIILLVFLFIVRILPFVIRVACVGTWLVMVFVAGYMVWRLFSLVTPNDWTNYLLGLVASFGIAMFPFDRMFTKDMFGRCGAGAVVGGLISVAADSAMIHPETLWIVRLVPNILSISLVVMLTKEKHHGLELEN